MAHTGKYRALAWWLASQTTSRVEATFAEIEEILGFALPPSARQRPQPWHSYDGSAVTRAIVDAGWVARDLDLGAERVVFERK